MKFCALLSFIFMLNAHSALRPKKNARLLGLGGAGVGSILAPEALMLNPATITFFEESHIYLARHQNSWNDKKTTVHRNDQTTEDIILTDPSSRMKGGMSYSRHEEKDTKRRIYSFAMGTSAGKSSAMGFLVKRNEESSSQGNDVFNQLTFGYSRVFSSSLTGGLVIQDIGRGKSGETRSILGIQYNLTPKISLMLDWGSYYLQDALSDTFYHYAIQISLLEDLFIRTGLFENDVLKIRGQGWGATWVGPKLSFEFGMMLTKATDGGYFIKGEEFKEISFAVDVRF